LAVFVPTGFPQRAFPDVTYKDSNELTIFEYIMYLFLPPRWQECCRPGLPKKQGTSHHV